MEPRGGGDAVPPKGPGALRRAMRAALLGLGAAAAAIGGYGLWEGRWPWDRTDHLDLPGVDVIDRSGWSADPVRGRPSPLGRPTRITLHHSGVVEALDGTSDVAARRIKAIQWEHQNDRGWIDIGYHFIVDGAGRVWAGRSLRQEGAHAGPNGANRANIGILLLGNFDEQTPTAEQKHSTRRLIDALRERCGIATKAVVSHDEVRRGQGLAGTRCPGGTLLSWLEGYRDGAATAALIAPPSSVAGAPRGP